MNKHQIRHPFIQRAVKLLATAGLLLGWSMIQAHAASAFAGFYTGYVYSSISGTVTVPESPIGAAAFTVDENGNITGHLSGAVDGSGNITWNPNDTGFTTGTISGGMLASTTSQNNNGAITTFRIAANNNAGGFGTGSGTVAQNLVWRAPSPSGVNMLGITYGGGKFVAVGPGGSVAVSGNGANWVSVNAPTNIQLNAVTYGNGTFVTVGNSAAVLTSPDGLTWTPRSLNADIVKQNVTGVAFGNGTFVAVNLINEIYTSTDGISWTKVQTSSSGFYWSNVKYLNGVFVAVGGTLSSGSHIQTSADGAAWNTDRNPGGGPISDVAYGNGKWVAPGNAKVVTFVSADASDAASTAVSGLGDAIGFVNGVFVSDNRYYSTDGTTWKRDSYPNLDINDMVVGNGVLVAVGAAITSTVDGKIWTVHTKVLPLPTVNNVGYNGVLTGDYFDEISYYNYQGNSRYARVGLSGVIEQKTTPGATYTNAVSPTTNHLRAAYGTAFNAVIVGDQGTLLHYGGAAALDGFTNIITGTSADLRSVAANGATIVVVGAGGTILRTINSGQTWGSVNSGTANGLNRVSFFTGTGFNYFITVGDNGTILKSTDGSAWTTLSSGTTKRLVSIANRTVGNVKLQAVAEDSTVVVSEDHGTTWRSITVNAPFAITYADGTYARGVGGFQMTTSDGTNWSYTLPGGGVVGLAHGNGRVIGAGNQGFVITTDLDNWTAIAPPYGHTPVGIAYANGLFLSLGSGDTTTGKGFIATSIDGAKWINQTVATTSQLEDTVYAQGKFVAVGALGKIFSSTDTVTWVNRTISGSQNLHSITYGGGLFVAVGDSGNTRYSSDGETWAASTVGTSSSLRSIAYGNGLFVVVGDGATIRTSPNGTTWTSRTTTPATSGSRGFKSVSYTGGLFIAVGDQDGSNGAVVASSSDGVTWTKDISNILLGLTCSSAGNGTFVTGGGSSAVFSAPYQSSISPPVVSAQPSPASQTVNAGADVTYTATVSGTGLKFQWFRDGTPLMDGQGVSGTTAASLMLTGVDALDTAVYQLVAYNDAGSVLSQSLSLNVNGPPVITVHPMSATTSNTLTTNFTVTAVGPGVLAYSWRKNGQTLANGGHYSGVTTSKLTISSASGADEAAYDVIVSNGFGNSDPSTPANLNVNRPATIVQGPAALNINQGQTITVSAQADGTPTITYVWKRNGATLSNGGRVAGADTATLTITSAQVSDAGSYTVTVANSFTPSATSTSVFVSVLGPGALRPDFSYNGTGQVWDIAPTPDGNYLIGGDGGLFLGLAWSGLVKISSNGVPISTFATTNSSRIPNSTVKTVAVQADGQLVVGGSFWQWGGDGQYAYTVRLNSDGVLDTAYKPNPAWTVPKIIPVAGNKVLVARTGIGSATSWVARYNTDGTKDGTFTEVMNANRQLNGMAVQSNGTIWMSGLFGLKKADADGSSPTSVSTYAPFPEMGGVFVGPDDKVYYSSSSSPYFGRLNADGSRDTSFTNTINGQVLDMAFLPNNRLVIVGNFQLVNSVTTPYIAVLDDTGALVGGFISPYTWASGGTLWTIELLGDSSALVGGNVQMTLPTNQRYVQRIQIGDPPATGTTFAQWLGDKGLTSGANDGPANDPDNDGLPNIGEFAFGSHPGQSGSNNRPASYTVNDGGTLYPSVRFIRNRLATGVTIVVTAASDLSFASPLGTTMLTPADLGGDLEEVTIRANVPLSSTTTIFFRVQVNQP